MSPIWFIFIHFETDPVMDINRYFVYGCFICAHFVLIQVEEVNLGFVVMTAEELNFSRMPQKLGLQCNFSLGHDDKELETLNFSFFLRTFFKIILCSGIALF